MSDFLFLSMNETPQLSCILCPSSSPLPQKFQNFPIDNSSIFGIIKFHSVKLFHTSVCDPAIIFSQSTGQLRAGCYRWNIAV